MNPGPPRNEARAPAPEPVELFRRAILALNREAKSGRAGYDIRMERLRESAGLLAAAMRAVDGTRPTAAGNREAVVKQEENKKEENKKEDRKKDEEAVALLAAILEADKPLEWDRRQYDRLRDLEHRYRLALPRLRTALAGKIPGYGSAGDMIARAMGSRPSKVLLAGLIILATGVAAAYQLADPGYTLQLGGQVFWINAPDARFSEDMSKSFEVRVDGDPHRYVVPLEPAAGMRRLRIDPVDRSDPTGITIDRVRLSGPGIRRNLDLGDNAGWRCVNCRWLPAEPGTLRLEPLNDDPHVVGPTMEPVIADRVEIDMQVFAKKTPWEWITRREK